MSVSRDGNLGVSAEGCCEAQAVSAKPLIEGCSIGAVLRASANNFRHNDEWRKRRGDPTDQQLQSIRILAAALRKPIADNGVNHPFGAHVCQETLELLSQGSFDKLSANLFAFANSMVIRRESARPR
jgi:hypothetical protein